MKKLSLSVKTYRPNYGDNLELYKVPNVQPADYTSVTFSNYADLLSKNPIFDDVSLFVENDSAYTTLLLLGFPERNLYKIPQSSDPVFQLKDFVYNNNTPRYTYRIFTANTLNINAQIFKDNTIDHSFQFTDMLALSLPTIRKFNSFDYLGTTYYFLRISKIKASSTEYYARFDKFYGAGVDELLADAEPYETETDPYFPGGTSGDDETQGIGGEGTFDGESEDIDTPDLPTLSSVQAGFVTLYNPSLSQLQALADYMWNPSTFDIETWQKSFANPMDAILGLSIVPVQPSVSGASAVKVGNYTTTVSMPTIGSQYVNFNCGGLSVEEYWGSYLDYSPYTRAQIYLPYIGIQDIDIDDIMKRTVSVSYTIDILSGSCVAFVSCGGSVLYTFSGSCSVQIPVNGQGYSSMVNAGNATISSLASKGLSFLSGAIGNAVGGITGDVLSGMLSTSADVASAYGQSKLSIQKSNAISGSCGLLGIQYPYLIVSRPRQCLPANQNKFSGYPSMITRTLSSCEGFTQVDRIHLENVSCTSGEYDEIISLLKGGVII